LCWEAARASDCGQVHPKVPIIRRLHSDKARPGLRGAAGDRPCCSIAGAGADGPGGSCHRVPGCGEAPGGQAGTARAGGALRAMAISSCFITGYLL